MAYRSRTELIRALIAAGYTYVSDLPGYVRVVDINHELEVKA